MRMVYRSVLLKGLSFQGRAGTGMALLSLYFNWYLVVPVGLVLLFSHCDFMLEW